MIVQEIIFIIDISEFHLMLNSSHVWIQSIFNPSINREENEFAVRIENVFISFQHELEYLFSEYWAPSNNIAELSIRAMFHRANGYIDLLNRSTLHKWRFNRLTVTNNKLSTAVWAFMMKAEKRKENIKRIVAWIKSNCVDLDWKSSYDFMGSTLCTFGTVATNLHHLVMCRWRWRLSILWISFYCYYYAPNLFVTSLFVKYQLKLNWVSVIH